MVVAQERLDEMRAHDHAADRRVARGHALRHRDDVGLVLVALRSEPVAEPPERADDLVGNEQHAGLVADLAHALEVAVAGREAAARVLHRLEEYRRDRLRSFHLDRERDRLRGIDRRRAVRVRVRNAYGAGHERLERHLDRGHARDRQRAHRRAVVRDVASDHLVAIGLTDGLEVLAGELPRGLDRFAPAGREEHTLEVAGGKIGEPFGELDRAGVRVAPHREVGELAHLLRGRVGEFGATVTDLRHEQSREPVEILLAVLVVDPRRLRRAR